MPRIRIHDPKSGFRFWLPVPYKIFINVFLRRSIVLNTINGNIKECFEQISRLPYSDTREKDALERRIHHLQSLYAIADAFDYGELRYALTNTSAYRGLVLVDIEAADGTIVKITL